MPTYFLLQSAMITGEGTFRSQQKTRSTCCVLVSITTVRCLASIHMAWPNLWDFHTQLLSAMKSLWLCRMCTGSLPVLQGWSMGEQQTMPQGRLLQGVRCIRMHQHWHQQSKIFVKRWQFFSLTSHQAYEHQPCVIYLICRQILEDLADTSSKCTTLPSPVRLSSNPHKQNLQVSSPRSIISLRKFATSHRYLVVH